MITAAPDGQAAATVPEPTERQMSTDNVDELPPIPEQVEGYAADGALQTERVRVSENGGPATPDEFWSPQNSCDRRFWAARWRSTNDDVTIRAGRSSPPELANLVDVDDLDLEAPAASGYMSGFHCQRPVLVIGDTGDTGAIGSTLVDVVIEWQMYEEAVVTPPVTGN